MSISRIIECKTVQDILDNIGLNEPFFIHNGCYESRLIDDNGQFIIETAIPRGDTVHEIQRWEVELTTPYTNHIQLAEDVSWWTSYFNAWKHPDYKTLNRAYEIVCDLLVGANYYGIDSDKLFELCMEEYGIVSGKTYEQFILKHMDRFSDDDDVRNKAIKELGY